MQSQASRHSGIVSINKVAAARERLIAALTIGAPSIAMIIAVPYYLVSGISGLSTLLLITFYSITVLGIGVGYHRMASHQSFKTTAPMRAVLGVMGAMAAQGPILHWAASHRHHHAHTDNELDFHSPVVRGERRLNRLSGFLHAHIGWLLRGPYANWARYVPDLLKDRTLCAINRNYLYMVLAGLLGPALIAFGLTLDVRSAVDAMFWAGFVRVGLVHHATWSINSICHIFGTRPFKTADHSANNPLIAIVTFGEGWHNNHHAFPASARHGLRRREYDINWYFIRTMQALGLAWSMKLPTGDSINKPRLE